MSVYDPEAFADRVNYACLCIKRGTRSRQFDTCCEMDDGNAVVVAVYRRSLNDPVLAEKIWTAFNQSSVMAEVERYKDVPTRELHKVARKLRQEAQERRQREHA